MAAGIFNKLKKAFKSIGQRIGGFAKKAINALPKIAEVSHEVVSKVSPILTNVIPGSGVVLNTIDKGLNYVSKFGKIGKSLIHEVD